MKIISEKKKKKKCKFLEGIYIYTFLFFFKKKKRRGDERVERMLNDKYGRLLVYRLRGGWGFFLHLFVKFHHVHIILSLSLSPPFFFFVTPWTFAKKGQTKYIRKKRKGVDQ